MSEAQRFAYSRTCREVERLQLARVLDVLDKYLGIPQDNLPSCSATLLGSNTNFSSGIHREDTDIGVRRYLRSHICASRLSSWSSFPSRSPVIAVFARMTGDCNSTSDTPNLLLRLPTYDEITPQIPHTLTKINAV
jgi:hypothetical protein